MSSEIFGESEKYIRSANVQQFIFITGRQTAMNARHVQPTFITQIHVMCTQHDEFVQSFKNEPHRY